MNDQTIHVAIAFDQNYLTPAYALVTSILRNNLENRIHFHAIATGISDNERSELVKYVEDAGSVLSFYQIDEDQVKRFVLINKWTSAVYYRLFFPLLIPKEIDRLLYLDTDTIVVNPLHELFCIDLEGYPLGAVYDNYVKRQPLLNILEEGEYFNSGMLLIDVVRWREQHISEKAIDYLNNHPERILFVDQCALNAVLHQNWKKLPERFNLLYSFIPETLTRWQIADYLTDKVIIHYTLQRPWSLSSKSRLGFLYHHYRKLSPVGTKTKTYTDFSFGKLLVFLKIKLFQLYLDTPGLSRLWRKTKTIIK